MTREEAIEMLKAKLNYDKGTMGEQKEYLRMAIEALELKPDPHWIKHKCNGMDYMECPNCSVWYMRMHLTRNSYCPNCGTKLLQPYCRGGYTAAGKSERRQKAIETLNKEYSYIDTDALYIPEKEV